MHPNRRKIAKLDAYKDVTLKEVAAEVAKDVEVQGRLEESQAHVYHIDLKHADKVLSMHDDETEPAKLKEVIEVVTIAKLMTEVVTAAATTINVAPIIAAPSAARRRNGVVIRDPKETATPSVIVHSEPKSKDKEKGILVEEPKPLKKQAQIDQDEAYARDLEIPSIKEETTNRIKSKEKYAFQFYYGFPKKGEKELEEEASKAIKRKGKSSKEKAAKKQKLDEEVEELKTHLQIVSNDEDDVYTEVTPLALKVNIKFNGGLLGLNNVLISYMLMLFSFGVDAVEDFKEYTQRDYYCWLKTYNCWYKLKLLDNAAGRKLRLLEESLVTDEKIKELH
nr:hypothetical protein [Tanacetum cinerariifolium]